MRELCIQEFIAQAKAYVKMKTLTPELLRVFIHRIEVFEKPEKYSRTAGNPSLIHFTFQPHSNTNIVTISFREEIVEALQRENAQQTA